MNQAQIDKAIKLHSKWLDNSSGGRQLILNNKSLLQVNLVCKNLIRADLSGSDLSVANLSHSNLLGANLTGANLLGANLTGANLIGANLIGARYNPVLLLSMINWGCVSEELNQLLMAYDAQNHPNPERFNEWYDTGICPYNNIKFERSVKFIQMRRLWDERLIKKKLPSAFKLFKMCCEEKDIKI